MNENQNPITQEDLDFVEWWLKGMIKTRERSEKRYRRRYLSACRKMCMFGWYGKEEQMIKDFRGLI